MHAAAAQSPPPGSLVLDHLAHFVARLDGAARALEALGFAVTPECAHQAQDGPAGTSNVCVMLERGYLEFLSPTLDTPNAGRVRDAMRRYAGMHLACFGTPDAAGEHARLRTHGLEPQPLVQLSRRVPTGETARFSVTMSSVAAMPEGRIQYVQHHTPEILWRPEYLRHPNGVVKLACVFVVADDPVAAGARWARFAALLPRPAGGFVHLPTARGHVLIGQRAQWRALLGAAPAAPALAGCALECRDPALLISRASRLGLAFTKLRRDLYALALPAAIGGAWLFGTRHSLALD